MPKFNPYNGTSCGEYLKQTINDRNKYNINTTTNILFFSSSPVYYINKTRYKYLSYKTIYMGN